MSDEQQEPVAEFVNPAELVTTRGKAVPEILFVEPDKDQIRQNRARVLSDIVELIQIEDADLLKKLSET